MRWFAQRDRPFFEVPHALIVVLVLANVAAYALCLQQSGTAVISADVLLRNGAMHTRALESHEYWRLFAYGLLHADGVHLAANMACLLLWGGHLEKRIGHLYFLLVYAIALVAAAYVSDLSHRQAYVSVGASGAISGILGALLFLGLFAKIDLAPSFFVVNIGLNLALAASNPRINWAAHIGGFAAGLMGCALLELIERANGHLLRCKFPEFIKLNGFAAAAALVGYLLAAGVPSPLDVWPTAWIVATLAVTCIIAVKLVDLILALRKGLAAIIGLLASANAAVVLLWGNPMVWGRSCMTLAGALPDVAQLACANPLATQAIVAGVVFVATMLVYRLNFVRGLTDVGFVGNSLRAERSRHRGL